MADSSNGGAVQLELPFGSPKRKSSKPSGRIKNLVGQRFERLTVLERAYRPNSKATFWLCECVCDTVKVVAATKLQSGNTRSCGCLKRDLKLSHGEAMDSCRGGGRAMEYNTWAGMLTRCRNPNHRDYSNYGGRGLKVCKRWTESYQDFLADMGRKPSREYSLDRINNDLGYVCGRCEECVANNWPANCRWATPRQQVENTRKRARIENFTDDELVSELTRRGFTVTPPAV